MRTTAILTASLLTMSLVSPVFAARPSEDYFNVNLRHSPPHAVPSRRTVIPIPVPTSAKSWFQEYDKAANMLEPSESDNFTLQRPLNGDPARVQSWINVAAKVARNYRALARFLQSLAVPPDGQELKEFKDLTANWYEDAASIYEDLIKPRRPFQTEEDLDECLASAKNRAAALADQMKELHSLETKLRSKIGVPMRKDALHEYTKGIGK